MARRTQAAPGREPPGKPAGRVCPPGDLDSRLKTWARMLAGGGNGQNRSSPGPVGIGKTWAAWQRRPGSRPLAASGERSSSPRPRGCGVESPPATADPREFARCHCRGSPGARRPGNPPGCRNGSLGQLRRAHRRPVGPRRRPTAVRSNKTGSAGLSARGYPRRPATAPGKSSWTAPTAEGSRDRTPTTPAAAREPGRTDDGARRESGARVDDRLPGRCRPGAQGVDRGRLFGARRAHPPCTPPSGPSPRPAGCDQPGRLAPTRGQPAPCTPGSPRSCTPDNQHRAGRSRTGAAGVIADGRLRLATGSYMGEAAKVLRTAPQRQALAVNMTTSARSPLEPGFDPAGGPATRSASSSRTPSRRGVPQTRQAVTTADLFISALDRLESPEPPGLIRFPWWDLRRLVPHLPARPARLDRRPALSREVR